METSQAKRPPVLPEQLGLGQMLSHENTSTQYYSINESSLLSLQMMHLLFKMKDFYLAHNWIYSIEHKDRSCES